MHNHKLLFLSLVLLVSNLNCADAPTEIPAQAEPPVRTESPVITAAPVRALTCREKIARRCTIGNGLILTAALYATVITVANPHDCCASKSSYLDTTSSKATFSENPYIDNIIDSARVLALQNHPGFGDPSKFRAAYPDYRPDLHPEHGDICESIPKSNYTIVCYNQLKTEGSDKCIAKVIKDYLKARGKPALLAPDVFDKRMQNLEQAGKDCVKKREFRYKPTTSHGPQKGGYRRKGDAR